MNASSVRVALVQMLIRPGRPAENGAVIRRVIAQERNAGADLIVFPELAVPGYLLGDEWERPAFLRECEAEGRRIAEAARGVTVAFGNVAVEWNRRNEDGRSRKYNACFVVENGHFLCPENGLGLPYAVKALLPNYREFDDSRHFFDLRKLALEMGRPPADLVAPFETRNGRLGFTLCEDAWDADYNFSPLRILAARESLMLINLSCSPYTFDKAHKRHRVFSRWAEETGRLVMYINGVGVQNNGKTVFAFDGGTAMYGPGGRIMKGPPPFTEGVLRVECPRKAPERRAGEPLTVTRDGVAELYRAIEVGTRGFMEQQGVRRVVVGVSGGIDSAVVAAIYRQLLEPRDLLLVNMPGPFTSARTRRLAAELASRLGCAYGEIPIGDSVEATRGQLHGLMLRSADGAVEERLFLTEPVMENIQARDRGARVLAAVAAAAGAVFTCNSNKSEATVGYATLYGDLGGYFANIADLWKGEVYALGRYLNETIYREPVIPEGIFAVTPSAELSPAQNVEEGRGDPLIYSYHDCLFRSWVETWERTTPEEILEWYLGGELEKRIGYEGNVRSLFPTAAAFIADLERWWNHYQGLAVAKRIQAPPILALKRRAFGFDHREALLGPRYTVRYGELKARALGEERIADATEKNGTNADGDDFDPGS